MMRPGHKDWVPPNSQDPNREWQIARGGRRYGPVQFDVLIRGLDNGTILPSDFVWTSGLPEWIPIAELVSRNLGEAKRPPSNVSSHKTGGVSQEPAPDGRKFPVSDSSSSN